MNCPTASAETKLTRHDEALQTIQRFRCCGCDPVVRGNSTPQVIPYVT